MSFTSNQLEKCAKLLSISCTVFVLCSPIAKLTTIKLTMY